MNKTRRSGFSLMEVLISSMLTGVVAVAALNTLGAATKSSIDTNYSAQAQVLADDILNEILSKPYPIKDALPVAPIVGAPRDTFDDIYDYHGLLESPPVDAAGLDLGYSTDWSREVQVDWYDLSQTTAVVPSANDVGYVGIFVIIRHKGNIIASIASSASRRVQQQRLSN